MTAPSPQLDQNRDQTFHSAISWTKPSRAYRVSTRSSANIRYRIGKNLPPRDRLARRKFSPQCDTFLIADPTFGATGWCEVGHFSKPQTRRACPNKKNRVRISPPPASQAPIASHGASSAPFCADDSFLRRRISLCRSRLLCCEKFANHCGLHRRDATEQNRRYLFFESEFDRSRTAQRAPLGELARWNSALTERPALPDPARRANADNERSGRLRAPEIVDLRRRRHSIYHSRHRAYPECGDARCALAQ